MWARKAALERPFPALAHAPNLLPLAIAAPYLRDFLRQVPALVRPRLHLRAMLTSSIRFA